MICIHQSIIKPSNKRIKRHEIEESWKPPSDLFSIIIDQKSAFFNSISGISATRKESVQRSCVGPDSDHCGRSFPLTFDESTLLEVEEEIHLNVEESLLKFEETHTVILFVWRDWVSNRTRDRSSWGLVAQRWTELGARRILMGLIDFVRPEWKVIVSWMKWLLRRCLDCLDEDVCRWRLSLIKCVSIRFCKGNGPPQKVHNL